MHNSNQRLIALSWHFGVILCCLLFSGSPAVTVPAPPRIATVQPEAPYTPQIQYQDSFENFPLNITLFSQVNSQHSPAFEFFFKYYLFLGTGWVFVIVLPLMIWRRRQRLWILVAAVLIEFAIVQLLKGLTDEPRPATLLTGVHLLQSFYWHSFPSGDVAQSFVIAAVLMHGERWWWRSLLLFLACLIAYERMYVGSHFPLDVTTGMLIGIFAVLAAERLSKVFSRKDAKMPQSDNAQAETAG